MTLLAISIIWYAIINIFVPIHFYIIVHRNKTPWHWLSFIFAAGLGIYISYVAWDTLTFFIVSIFYLGFMFWILFPLLLNFYRLKEPLHLGTKSWFDRMEAKMKNPGMTLGMKIILLIVCSFVLLDWSGTPEQMRVVKVLFWTFSSVFVLRVIYSIARRTI